MNTGGSYQKKTNGILMGSPNGVAPVLNPCTVAEVTAATGNLCSAMAPNPAYYNAGGETVSAGSFGRDTYIVAEWARVTSGDPKFDANLFAMVDSSKSTSLTNISTNSASKAGSVKQKFGFLAPIGSSVLRWSA